MTLDQLIEVYYRSVGRGAQLLLNIPPNRRGHMADADFPRAKEFGDEIRRRFGTSVAETRGNGERLGLKLDAAQRVDHVILEEDLRYGQRVRGFRLEGQSGGKWSELYAGSSIGHKRIVPVAAGEFGALRLVVTESVGEARIRRLAAFHVGAPAPATWNESAKLWADNTVGLWVDGKFQVDLSSKMTEATQYRIRLIAETGAVTGIGDLKLEQDGTDVTHLVRREPGTRNVLIVSMTGVGQKVVLSGTVAGAERGTILMQKM